MTLMRALPKAANSNTVTLYCFHDHINLLAEVFLTRGKTQSDIMSLFLSLTTIWEHKVLLRNTITLLNVIFKKSRKQITSELPVRVDYKIEVVQVLKLFVYFTGLF